MKFVVDSSVFVSSLGTDDEYSLQSRKFFRNIRDAEVIVSSLVIAETITILKKQRLKSVTRILQNLSLFNLIKLDQDFLKFFSQHIPVSTPLKTSDLIVAISAKMTDAILVTWDKKLLKYCGKMCKALMPSEALVA